MKNIFRTFFKKEKSLYDRIFFLSILAVAFLTPLLFTFRLKSVFPLPKLYAFSILLFIAMATVVVKYFKEGGLSLRSVKFNSLLGVSGLFLILSTAFSVNVYSSLFGTYGRFMGLFTLLSILIFVFLVFNFLRSKEDQISVLVGSYVSSVIVVGVGIVQHMGYLLDSSELNAVASRAFATLGHANHFGGFIVQFMFVSFALFVLLKNKFAKAATLIPVPFFLYALFQTGSRGAFLALAVTSALGVVIMLEFFRKKRGSEMKKILTITFAILLMLGAGVFGFREKLKNTEVFSRTVGTLEFIEDGNVPDRLSWTLSGVEMIRQNPLFGSGVSTFSDIYNGFRRLDYRVPGDEQDLIVPETAHNEYINTAATQGVPSLIIGLAIVIFAMQYAYRAAFTGKGDSVLVFLVLAVISYFVQVSVNFGTVGTTVPTYLLLAVMLGYAFSVTDSNEKTVVKGRAVTVMLIITLLFSATNFYVTHRMVKADRFLRLADVLKTHPDFVQEGYIYHIDALTRAVKLNPYAYNLYEELGGYNLKQALRVAEFKKTEILLEAALEAYDSALVLNDLHADTYKDVATIHSYFVEVYEQVGMLEKATEHKVLAYEAYENSIVLSPNNPLHRMIAADKYMLLGNQARALELYKEVKEMRPEYPGIDEKIQSASM